MERKNIKLNENDITEVLQVLHGKKSKKNNIKNSSKTEKVNELNNMLLNIDKNLKRESKYLQNFEDTNTSEYYINEILKFNKNSISNNSIEFLKLQDKSVLREIYLSTIEANIEKVLNPIKKIYIKSFAKLLSERTIDNKCFMILGINPTKKYKSLPYKIQAKLFELSELSKDDLNNLAMDVFKMKLSQCNYDLLYKGKNIEKESDEKLSLKIDEERKFKILISKIYGEIICNSPIVKKYYTRNEVNTTIEKNLFESADLWYEISKTDSESVRKDYEVKADKHSYRMFLNDLGFEPQHIKEYIDYYFKNYDYGTIDDVKLILKCITDVIQEGLKEKINFYLSNKVTLKNYDFSENIFSSFYENLLDADMTIKQLTFIIDNSEKLGDDLLVKIFSDIFNPFYEIKKKGCMTLDFFAKYKGKDIKTLKLPNKVTDFINDICFDYIAPDKEKNARINSSRNNKSDYASRNERTMKEAYDRLRNLILELK